MSIKKSDLKKINKQINKLSKPSMDEVVSNMTPSIFKKSFVVDENNNINKPNVIEDIYNRDYALEEREIDLNTKEEISDEEYINLNVVKDNEYKAAKIYKNKVLNIDDDSSRFLSTALHVWELDKVDFKQPQVLEDRIKLYFEDCYNFQIKPSIEKLATYVGCRSRKHFLNSMNNEDIPSQSRDLLQKAAMVVNSVLTELSMDGKIPPLTYMFIMKNNFGYSDKTEIEVKTDTSSNILTEDELKEKYAGLDIIDVEIEKK